MSIDLNLMDKYNILSQKSEPAHMGSLFAHAYTRVVPICKYVRFHSILFCSFYPHFVPYLGPK